MISHNQLIGALRKQGVPATDVQVNKVMLELLPNPQAGFGVSGVVVWGDGKSIDAVRNWHHAATAVVPSLHACIDEMKKRVS